MGVLYSFGYSGQAPETLYRELLRLEAVLVDVRYSPRSRVPAWSGLNLQRTFAGKYVHLREFGNANYNSGGKIQLFDAEAGISRVARLIQQHDVVLMCGCRARETCHRALVAAILSQRLDVHNSGELFPIPYRSAQLKLGQ